MRGWVVIAFAAGCTARPFVDVDDDGGVTSGPASSASADGGGAESIFTASVSADDDGDDGKDDGADLTGGDITGTEPDCVEPVAPTVAVDVYPGGDPLEADGGMVAKEWDCAIQVRIVDDAGVSLGLQCETEPPWFATVVVTVDAEGITIPAELDAPAQVHLRVQTYRDGGIDEFPWLRSDHFAMYQDDALVLGAGAGNWWPTTDTGGDFWAPVYIEGSWSSCDAIVSECHEVTPGSLLVVHGDEKAMAPSYSLVSIGGYDVHVGEMAGTDSPKCGEPSYNWSSFAIAPTP